MIGRPDREDVSRQLETLAAAWQDMGEALVALSVEAKDAAKACRRRNGKPDVEQVAAAYNAFERAREAVEMAGIDLAGARGADL